MRQVETSVIIEAVAKLCQEANFRIGKDIISALECAVESEESAVGKDIISRILENDAIADRDNVPLCQDTGMAIVFVEIGQEVHVVGGGLEDAINEGIRKGYTEGYLRKSVVKDPFNRVNTQDNTPGVIHYEIVPGDKLKITVAPKGFGSENMSAISMFKPSAGLEGAKKFILDTVDAAGSNPCPPIVVGVGCGGSFEKAAWLAKKSPASPRWRGQQRSLLRRPGEGNAGEGQQSWDRTSGSGRSDHRFGCQYRSLSHPYRRHARCCQHQLSRHPPRRVGVRRLVQVIIMEVCKDGADSHHNSLDQG